jgi:hypothetical protein
LRQSISLRGKEALTLQQKCDTFHPQSRGSFDQLAPVKSTFQLLAFKAHHRTLRSVMALSQGLGLPPPRKCTSSLLQRILFLSSRPVFELGLIQTLSLVSRSISVALLESTHV